MQQLFFESRELVGGNIISYKSAPQRVSGIQPPSGESKISA
jgi:hypothetical protein